MLNSLILIVSVNGELIRAKHIVIATGAHPSIPNIPGAELGGLQTMSLPGKNCLSQLLF